MKFSSFLKACDAALYTLKRKDAQVCVCISGYMHGGNDTLVWKHFAFGIAILFFFLTVFFLLAYGALLSPWSPCLYTCPFGSQQHLLTTLFLLWQHRCSQVSALSKPCKGVGEVRERGRSGFRSPASSQSGSGLRTGGSLCLTAVTQHPALLELLVLHPHRCLQGHKLGC